jgi:DNA gyrase/topoisomerase IV subunit A
LVDGVPQTLSLKTMLEEFIKHRKTVVRRRTEFDLAKAKDREHIEGQIRANADKLYATRRPAGKAAAAAAEKEEGGETASASKEPVVKAPARSSESELDIMVED